MSSYIKAELAATCSSLGRMHHGKYVIDSQCYESIRDLIRFLRRDDEYHEVRRYLGEAKVLQSDLIHIITNCPTESAQLFDITVRLLVNLTNPVLLLYREEVPLERVGRNLYMTLVAHSQNYKIAFCDIEFWNTICAKLTDLFEIDWSERSDDDSLQIERMLVLLRNVLQVPADVELERRPENDITVHDQVLWALRQSQILELLLYVSSRRDEQQYYLHLLEIFSLILREQNPLLLAQSEIQRSNMEREKDANELVEIREREKENAKHFKNMRNFSTTFVLKNVKSFSDQNMIYHKSLDSLSHLKLTQDKKRLKTPKNRVPVESERLERRSTFSVRLFLKEFCVEFLNCSFNMMMAVVKEKLVSGKGLSNDETYYFWALKFFLEFNCGQNLDVKLISECINTQSFHFVQTQMESCFERLTADKKKAAIWVRRIHLILKAYHSLLKTLVWMDAAKDSNVRETSKVIKSNIFYMPEYRELMLYCLLRYDPSKYSLSYLRDLIDTTHIFLKLLEDFCKQSRVVVQKKGKAPKSKKKQSKAASQPCPESNEGKWEKISSEVLNLLTKDTVFPEIPPFDAALDQPIEEQQEWAIKKTQKHLNSNELKEAIGLLRSAREVWPEDALFGSADMAAEEEAMLLQEICLAELGNVDQPATMEVESENDNEEMDDERAVEFSEKNFDVKDFTKRLANKKIVEGCCILLKNYKKNTNHTNHSVVKLLHRIGWECCMPSMLYQASLFLTLTQALKERNTRYRELQTFSVHLIRKFRDNAGSNPKIYMELLFWKDPKAAYDVENGYGRYDENNKVGAAWSQEEEDEVRRLWGETAGMASERARVDFVKAHLSNDTRSNVGLIKKLKQMELLPKGYRMPAKGKCAAEWSEEEVEELSKLYSELQGAINPVALIWNQLSIKRSKKSIRDKLVELKLVDSVSQLKTKRGRKATIDTPAADSPSEAESSSDQEEEEVQVQLPVYSEKEQRVALRAIEHMTEALEWLKETYEECLEDNDDSSEGYPLLALEAAHTDALDKDEFVDALRKLGLVEPVDQQIYWKIPKTEAGRLKNIISLIDKCLRKDLGEEVDGNDKSDDDSEDEFDKLRGVLRRGETNIRNGGDVGSDVEPSATGVRNPPPSQRNIDSDASASEGSDDEKQPVRKKKVNGTQRRKHSRLIESDQSDAEEQPEETHKRAVALGSDSDAESRNSEEDVAVVKFKRRRCIGSDSEVEEIASGEESQLVTDKFPKRPKMITSDSEGEGNGSMED